MTTTPVAAKPPRIPFGHARSKLEISMTIEGFHLHWVNDSHGRLMAAQQGGYQFVSPKEIGSSEEGTQVKRLAGTREDGDSLFAYLMKIELDLYAEDQAVLQNEVKKFETAIKAGTLEEKGGHRYDAGIKIS